MAKFKSLEDMKQVKLLGFWQPDRDNVYDDNGELKGIYVDWQVDQTDLTTADIKAGNYDRNPHLVTKETENGVSHKSYCSIEQIDEVLKLYRDSRDFNLEPRYHRDDVVSLGVVADVQASPFADKGQLHPMLPMSEKLNKNSMSPDFDREIAIEHNEEYPCHASPTCRSDGSPRPDDKQRQLSGVYEIAKFFDAGLDRVDRLRDADGFHFEHKIGIAEPDIPGWAKSSFDSERSFLEEDAYNVRSTVDHMLERDGRFQSIDYSLFSDPKALATECAKHDGLIQIRLDDGWLSVSNRDKKSKSLFEQMSTDSFVNEMESDRANGYEFAWYDSMERQIALENEAAKNGHEYHVSKIESNFDFDATRSADVHLEPRSAAKVLSSEKFVKDVPLIVSWSNKDLTRGPVAPGAWGTKITGAYVDVQIDQSNLNKIAIENGKGYSNPSVNCSSHKDPKVAMNKLWYSTKQLEQMQNVGSIAEHTGFHGGDSVFADKHYCSFTANLMVRDNKSGQKTTVVLLPREITPEMTDIEKATVDAYNRVNAIKPSQHGDSFSMKDVNRQIAVTSQVCDLTDFPSQHMSVEREQDKSMNLQAVADIEFE